MNYQQALARARELQYDYRKKPSYIKNKRMLSWKNTQKMKCWDWDEVYNIYDNCKYCQLCGVEFSTIIKRNAKILDHDHLSGYVRNVCCCKCNNKLAVLDRLRNVLHLELHRYFLRK